MAKTRAKELETAVKNLLMSFGYEFHRVDNYRCFKCGQVQNSGAKGFPDFFCFFPRILAIEVKTGAGRLKPDQIHTKELMERTGIEYIVVKDTVDELLKKLEYYHKL